MTGASKILTQSYHFMPLIDPIADYLNGTVSTTPVKMGEAYAATFFFYWGVGATGTSTFTIEACDDAAASNVSALTFRSRRRAATDVWGALTARTTAGFLTTAGSSQMYALEVDADQLAASGYGYVRCKAVEGTASARLGGAWVVLHLTKERAITATQF